jgi:tetratricopeptide (TPR) repeat protein
VQAIDSLYLRALTLDPFLDRAHEGLMLRTALRTWMREELSRESGGFSVTEDLVDQWINSYMLRAGPEVRAMEAQGARRYGEALRFYERALEGRKRKSFLRTERSRIYHAIGDMEQARTEMELALDEMRREDERDLVYLYESKALLEHGIAVLHERSGDLEAAREAYGRALQEDLAFFPAHGRLGMLAAAEGDTATALASFDLAVQVAPNDPAFRQTYGYLLMRTGDLDAAAEQLTAAIEAGPYYAESYLVLGLLREQRGEPEQALTAYRGFVERAGRDDGRLAVVQQRLAALEAAAPSQEQR